MNWRLTPGLSEDRDFRWPRIPRETFLADGPYQSALLRLGHLQDSPATARAFDCYWERCLAHGSTLPAATKDEAWPIWLDEIRWTAVEEAERARLWSEAQPDYTESLRAYSKASQADAARIKKALEDLRRLDERHAYLLRSAFQRALQDFLADEAVRRVRQPDANLDKGYRWRTVSGPTVRDHEFQYISRMAFSRFDDMLAAWGREIDFMFKPCAKDWMQFGALRFHKALSQKAAAKLNVAQLGLFARLSSRLRDFTAGFGVRIYSTGQPVPKHGKPCWDIVAEFANCALRPSEPLAADTAARAWNKLSSKHDIRMQLWPHPAKKEPQFQKK